MATIRNVFVVPADTPPSNSSIRVELQHVICGTLLAASKVTHARILPSRRAKSIRARSRQARRILSVNRASRVPHNDVMNGGLRVLEAFCGEKGNVQLRHTDPVHHIHYMFALC